MTCKKSTPLRDLTYNGNGLWNLFEIDMAEVNTILDITIRAEILKNYR